MPHVWDGMRRDLGDESVVVVAAEHLVRVEAGADGLAEVAQRLQLLHLAGQLGPARLERGGEVDLPEHDGRLRGEGAQQLALTVVEGVHLQAPHRESSHDFVVEDHRRRQQ